MDCCGTKPAAPGAMAMPSMMQKMMEGTKEFNPVEMCQAMMTSVSKSAEMAAYARPEVRALFEEWARSVEEEILTIVKAQGEMDLGQLAVRLKISPESALVFLGRLVRDGKVTISGIGPVARAES